MDLSKRGCMTEVMEKIIRMKRISGLTALGKEITGWYSKDEKRKGKTSDKV